MPGRDLWTVPAPAAIAWCRGSKCSIQTLEADVAGQLPAPDSTSTLVRARWRPVHFVHNRLIRTIEDLGALVDGNRAYLIAQPRRRPGADNTRSWRPLTPFVSDAEAERQFDGVELGVSAGSGEQLVRQREPDNQPSVRQLRGSRELGRNPHADDGVSWATAQQQAGSIFRQGGNVNRGWDLDDAMFDSHGNLDVLGRLATDRPVVAKFYGGYNCAQHARSADSSIVGSGTPMSTYVNSVNQTEIFVEGRGDMGRTPMFSKTDVLVSHELAMAGNKRLRLELNVLNLFNQKTARHVFNYLNRGAGCGPRVVSDQPDHHSTSTRATTTTRCSVRRRTEPTPTTRATAWTTCSKRARRVRYR